MPEIWFRVPQESGRLNERLVRRSDDAAALAQRSGRLLRALNVAFGLSWRLYENSSYTSMHMHIYEYLCRYICAR